MKAAELEAFMLSVDTLSSDKNQALLAQLIAECDERVQALSPSANDPFADRPEKQARAYPWAVRGTALRVARELGRLMRDPRFLLWLVSDINCANVPSNGKLHLSDYDDALRSIMAARRADFPNAQAVEWYPA